LFHANESKATYPFSTLSPIPVPVDGGTAPPLPFLSQADHPTLGTPCWFLHPCQTEAIVAEVLKANGTPGATEERMLNSWLETWFMVVGTVVDLRE